MGSYIALSGLMAGCNIPIQTKRLYVFLPWWRVGVNSITCILSSFHNAGYSISLLTLSFQSFFWLLFLFLGLPLLLLRSSSSLLRSSSSSFMVFFISFFLGLLLLRSSSSFFRTSFSLS